MTESYTSDFTENSQVKGEEKNCPHDFQHLMLNQNVSDCGLRF